MPANAVNRKTIRAKLVTLFTDRLVTSLSLAQIVLGYQTKDFQGKAPAVLILSKGSGRKQGGLGTIRQKSKMKFSVMVFVPKADPDNAWTEAQVEDRLDDLEVAIANLIADNRGSANDATLPWHYIDFGEDISDIRPAAQTVGKAFYIEFFELNVEVRDVAA